MSPMVAEKEAFLPTVGPETQTRVVGGRRACLAKRTLRLLVPLLLLTYAIYHYGYLHRACHSGHDSDELDTAAKDLCPQPSSLVPSKNGDLWKTLGKSYETEAFQGRAVSWLSRAVQVP